MDISSCHSRFTLLYDKTNHAVHYSFIPTLEYRNYLFLTFYCNGIEKPLSSDKVRLHHSLPFLPFSSPSLPDGPGLLAAASVAAVSPLQAAPLRGPGRTTHPPGGPQLPAPWVSKTSCLTPSFPHDRIQLPPLHNFTLMPPLCLCEAGA